MSRGTIFFAPGNGFPAGTYNKMLGILGRDFDVDRLELPGHDPKFPPDDNWGNLRDELRREIQSRHSVPVVGVGHSLGGVLHLLVAAENPEIYSQIVLLEAPIISRFSSHSLRFMKRVGLIDRLSPSRMTRFRRSRWASEEEALSHFAGKPKFAAFDPAVLRDYIGAGIKRTDQGLELVFRPSIEAKIYRTIPHDLPRLRGRLRMPVTFIGGSESRESRLARLGFMKKSCGVEVRFVQGSHLFPMESPLEAADAVVSAINRHLPA